MSDIRIVDVSKSFGGTVVVDHVSLEVKDGEFIVFVGPSGCGKTTTLRMLAGLEEVGSGNIYIGDRDVTDVHPKDRNVAMVFQSYALYPHKTVAQNLAFALRLRKRPAAEIAERIDRVAKTLEIEQLLNRRPSQLSGGQRQRVALGRAIIRNPEVFLFDEPLSNLDAKLRNATRSELLKLHRTLNATMVYVTHDQVEAMTMGDRIVVMDGGVVQQVGAPLEIYDSPVNTFVAGFIGSPAMNFFTCPLRTEGDMAHAMLGEATISFPASRLRGPADKVTLGIRPEALSVAGRADHIPIDAVVEDVEHLGAETIVDMLVGSYGAISRIARADHLRHGDRLTMTVDPAKVHVFDGKDGVRLQ